VTGYLDRHYQLDTRVNFKILSLFLFLFCQTKQESRAESRGQHLNDDTIQKQVHQRTERTRQAVAVTVAVAPIKSKDQMPRDFSNSVLSNLINLAWSK
jgi:hypothetical protein